MTPHVSWPGCLVLLCALAGAAQAQAPELLAADPAPEGARAAGDDVARAAPRRPPVVRLSAGLAPRSVPYGRLGEGLYDLYGWSTDLALRGACREPEPRALGRLAKGLLLDAGLAWFLSGTLHELGHIEAGRLAGATPRVERSPVPSFMGVWISIEGPEWDRLDRGERLDFHAGGLAATQAAAADLAGRLAGDERVPWSKLPLYVAEKIDLSRYVLFSPRPGREGPEHRGSDIVQWRDQLAAAARRDPDAVDRELRLGALWNAADPLLLGALLGYVRYLVTGDEELPRLTLDLGAVELSARTSFALTRTGPRFRLTLYAREPRSGLVVALSPSLGTGQQLGLEVEVARLPLGEWLKASLFAAAWRQRRGPEPGPLRLGGAAGAGCELWVDRHLGFELRGGAKTSGFLLGRGWDAGAFGELSVLVAF
ncbi:MAG: hypothetical protein AB7N76_36765 [Planctomycetota bacterium]